MCADVYQKVLWVLLWFKNALFVWPERFKIYAGHKFRTMYYIFTVNEPDMWESQTHRWDNKKALSLDESSPGSLDGLIQKWKSKKTKKTDKTRCLPTVQVSN